MANDTALPSAGRTVDVEITTTIDFAGIERRLLDAERKVFARHERKIMAFLRDEWTGWAYKGRPPGAPRLVSHDAWTSEISTTESAAVLRIRNAARGYRSGKPYVAHVHRAGRTTPEHEVAWASVLATLEPALRADLTEEVRKSILVKGPRKKIRGGRSTRATAVRLGGVR